MCEEFRCNPDKVDHWKGKLPPLKEVAATFKVLADETRTSILYLLAQEELCVCDIATILGSSVSNISHHLRLLRAQRLVKYRRQGKMVFYSLDDEHVLALIDQAFVHVQHKDQL
ncbi:MAG TPA: helix-turn-helix transcriptional regulator [Firmicutes bacterium]|nr:helix-turn-helix transcriptional regulator [Bacillota bacterium]